MEIKLEKIQLKEEDDLFYSQSNELADLGCIGHLRGDFGSDGKEFFSTWHPHKCESENNEAFSSVLGAVVDTLRKDGNILRNRKDMIICCAGRNESRLTSYYNDRCWGFRILTADYAFYLRCMTDLGDYNFYIYCYNRNTLFSHLSQKRGLPMYSYAYLPAYDEIVRIQFAEHGYYRHADGSSCDSIAALNETVGVSKKQAEAMRFGSMLGWDTPGANPAYYNENGTFKKI